MRSVNDNIIQSIKYIVKRNNKRVFANFLFVFLLAILPIYITNVAVYTSSGTVDCVDSFAAPALMKSSTVNGDKVDFVFGTAFGERVYSEVCTSCADKYRDVDIVYVDKYEKAHISCTRHVIPFDIVALCVISAGFLFSLFMFLTENFPCIRKYVYKTEDYNENRLFDPIRTV